MKATTALELQLLNGLLHNDNNSIKQIYKDCRQICELFVVSNGGSITDAEDIFQEAIMVLYNQVLHNSNFELTCAIKTYLYNVNRHLWLDQLKSKHKRLTSFKDFMTNDANIFSSVVDDVYDYELDIQKQKMMTIALEKLDEKCSQLLQLFYIKDKSMEEIAGILHYNNADTVKNMKYKCLMKLKNIVFNYKK